MKIITVVLKLSVEEAEALADVAIQSPALVDYVRPGRQRELQELATKGYEKLRGAIRQAKKDAAP